VTGSHAGDVPARLPAGRRKARKRRG